MLSTETACGLPPISITKYFRPGTRTRYGPRYAGVRPGEAGGDFTYTNAAD
jgi:hypothetical protein